MQIELGKFVAIQYHLTGFEAPENPEQEPEVEEIEKTSPERPFTFLFGVGQLLPEFEKNIAGKEAGYKFDFYLSPSQAYGEYQDELVVSLPKKYFCDPQGKFLSQFVMEGGEVPLQNENGDIIQATVEKITDTEVVCDVNHPLAGMTLHFVGEVTEVRDATEEDKKRYMQQMTGHAECHCGGSCGGGNCSGDCGSCGEGGCGGNGHHHSGGCGHCKH